MTKHAKPRGSQTVRGSQKHKQRYLHTTPLLIFLLVFVVVGFSLVVYASWEAGTSSPAFQSDETTTELVLLQAQHEALQARLSELRDQVSTIEDAHVSTLAIETPLTAVVTQDSLVSMDQPEQPLTTENDTVPITVALLPEPVPEAMATPPVLDTPLDDTPMYQLTSDPEVATDGETWSYVPDHQLINRDQLAQQNPLPTPEQIATQLTHVSSLFPGHTVHPEITWATAQQLLPRYENATLIDVATGRSFRIQRTFGTNHADIETLTTADSQVVYELWGGHSWAVRAVIVVTDNGHIMPGSMNGYPHAGVDGLPPIQVVDNRSGGFGRGQNLQLIQGNGISGHFCLHFSGSLTHGTQRLHEGHQAQVRIAREVLSQGF